MIYSVAAGDDGASQGDCLGMEPVGWGRKEGVRESRGRRKYEYERERERESTLFYRMIWRKTLTPSMEVAAVA